MRVGVGGYHFPADNTRQLCHLGFDDSDGAPVVCHGGVIATVERARQTELVARLGETTVVGSQQALLDTETLRQVSDRLVILL